MFFDIAKESAYKVFYCINNVKSIQGNEYCCLLYKQNNAVELTNILILHTPSPLNYFRAFYLCSKRLILLMVTIRIHQLWILIIIYCDLVMSLLQKDKPQNPTAKWMSVWLMGITVLEITSAPLWTSWHWLSDFCSSLSSALS